MSNVEPGRTHVAAFLMAYAERFRHALELYQAENPELVLSSDPARALSKFPHDCCKSASYMLGYALSKVFPPEDLRYVMGVGGRHGWLECGEFLMDITADQFDDEDRTVIVTPWEESEWHLRKFRPFGSWPWKLREGHPLIGHAEAVMARVSEEAPVRPVT